MSRSSTRPCTLSRTSVRDTGDRRSSAAGTMRRLATAPPHSTRANCVGAGRERDARRSGVQGAVARRRGACVGRGRRGSLSPAEQLARPDHLRVARRAGAQREAARGLGPAGAAALLQPARGAARVPQRRPCAQGAADQGRRRGLGLRRRGRLVDTRHAPARGLRPRQDREGTRERERLRRQRGTRHRGHVAKRAVRELRGTPSAPGAVGRTTTSFTHTCARASHRVQDRLGDVLGAQHLADLLA